MKPQIESETKPRGAWYKRLFTALIALFIAVWFTIWACGASASTEMRYDILLKPIVTVTVALLLLRGLVAYVVEGSDRK